MLYFCYGSGYLRELHVLTHSFPTRRSSALPDNDRRHGFSPLDDSPSFGRYPDVRASEAFGSRSPAALQRHHHWPKVGDRSNEANFETKMSMTSAYTRRGLLGLFAVVSGAALAGCDRKPAAAVGVSGAAGPSSPVKGKVGVPILVYRDPECGCCEAWADIARAEG